jgi:hypothetical protein
MTIRKTPPSATALIVAALLLLGANGLAGAAPGKGHKNQTASQKSLRGATTNQSSSGGERDRQDQSAAGRRAMSEARNVPDHSHPAQQARKSQVSARAMADAGRRRPGHFTQQCRPRRRQHLRSAGIQASMRKCSPRPACAGLEGLSHARRVTSRQSIRWWRRCSGVPGCARCCCRQRPGSPR